MNNNRPVNLDLMTMKFPPMAIASILHRISGIVLFLTLPAVLYVLAMSLESSTSFEQARLMLAQSFWKGLFWAFSAALIYHLLAGIRHILMDFGLGEQLNSGRRTALFVIVLTIILSISLGIWIW